MVCPDGWAEKGPSHKLNPPSPPTHTYALALDDTLCLKLWYGTQPCQGPGTIREGRLPGLPETWGGGLLFRVLGWAMGGVYCLGGGVLFWGVGYGFK